jgi:enoyl-[acyl-carrier protein] reductase I
MTEILKGKNGIIFGALNEQSIAWKVAERAHKEGAKLVLTNTAVSIRIGNLKKLAEETDSKCIAVDATKPEELESLLTEAIDFFGAKVDFVLHAVAMSNNTRKGRSYFDLDYENYLKTLDVSALSFHKILQSAWKLDALNEWASVVALSYIAAQRSVDGYGDMAEAKAALESIARNFGAIYGKRCKVRINTVSQSPAYTPATSVVKGFDKLFNYTDGLSPLGNAPAEDCAAFITTLFSDYTRMITMQNIYHDGGFSSMGIPDMTSDI